VLEAVMMLLLVAASATLVVSHAPLHCLFAAQFTVIVVVAAAFWLLSLKFW